MRLALLVLLASVAHAHLPGDTVLEVRQGGSPLCTTNAVDLDASEFSCACQADGSVACSLGADVTELGPTIGDNTDWAATLNLDGKTVDCSYDDCVLQMPYKASCTPTGTGSLCIDSSSKVMAYGDGSTTYYLPRAPASGARSSFFAGWTVFFAAGVSTTANYVSFLAHQNFAPSATETERQSRLPSGMACDKISVCGSPNPNAATEDVTVTLRKNAADTALSCVQDGDSGTSTCTGTSTAKGCTDTESTPVSFAADDLVAWQFQCAGAACPSTSTVYSVLARCWLTE